MGRPFPHRLLSLVVLACPLLIALACADRADGPLIAIELETMENTLDGCTSCGCRITGELLPGEERLWWTAFGQVAPDEQARWRAVGSTSHCGSGSFDALSTEFRRTVGVPYVILDLVVTTTTEPQGSLSLDTKLRARVLTGFDEGGEHRYAESAQKRSLALDIQDAITLPLLIADPDEREAFGVHEVLVQLRARSQAREAPAGYGSLSISADVPAAEILLDGGVVGRIAEGRPTVLRHVLAGKRMVAVRDLSERTAETALELEPGASADVSFELLPTAESQNGLLPLGQNPQGQEEFFRVKDKATVVKIPAGEFLMGSPEGQGAPDERPQHRVHTSAFLMDKTEVTWRQFRKFGAAEGASLPPEPISGAPDDYPVGYAIWDDAAGYCAWVGGRLPTEAEWEKAARGSEGWKYSWGDTWDATRCNAISGGLHSPEAVGSYPGCVSPYGVLDMLGSMWEWCSDRYGEAYYEESPERDPKGATSGRLHVMRGGDWMSQPDWLRTAYRAKRSPTSRNLNHGFRCVHDASEPAQ